MWKFRIRLLTYKLKKIKYLFIKLENKKLKKFLGV